jgi:hypothetical protein
MPLPNRKQTTLAVDNYDKTVETGSENLFIKKW